MTLQRAVCVVAALVAASSLTAMADPAYQMVCDINGILKLVDPPGGSGCTAEPGTHSPYAAHLTGVISQACGTDAFCTGWALWCSCHCNLDDQSAGRAAMAAATGVSFDGPHYYAHGVGLNNCSDRAMRLNELVTASSMAYPTVAPTAPLPPTMVVHTGSFSDWASEYQLFSLDTPATCTALYFLSIGSALMELKLYGAGGQEIELSLDNISAEFVMNPSYLGRHLVDNSPSTQANFVGGTVTIAFGGPTHVEGYALWPVSYNNFAQSSNEWTVECAEVVTTLPTSAPTQMPTSSAPTSFPTPSPVTSAPTSGPPESEGPNARCRSSVVAGLCPCTYEDTTCEDYTGYTGIRTFRQRDVPKNDTTAVDKVGMILRRTAVNEIAPPKICVGDSEYCVEVP